MVLIDVGNNHTKLLVIDVGNTNTVLGVFQGTQLRAQWRLTTNRAQTGDEYGILIRNLFALDGIQADQIAGNCGKEKSDDDHDACCHECTRQHLRTGEASCASDEIVIQQNHGDEDEADASKDCFGGQIALGAIARSVHS